jgi:hypothetical protein
MKPDCLSCKHYKPMSGHLKLKCHLNKKPDDCECWSDRYKKTRIESGGVIKEIAT